jgi:hypothetical protein
VIEKLINMEYKNIYFSIKGSGEYIESYVAESTNNSVPGFATSSKSRPLIIAKLEEFIRNKLIKIKSKRTINEMRTFVWNNGRPQAMRSCNDDLVMSLAIACWVRDTAIIANRRSDEYKKALIGGMFLANTQIDVKVPGQQGYNRKLDLEKKRDDAKKQHEEYGWVYKG